MRSWAQFDLSRPARTAQPSLSRLVLLVVGLLLVPALAVAGDSKLSEAQRTQIIRNFLAERPWVHRALPRGKAGVRIEESGKIVPSEAEMNQLVAQLGAAAKPGDRVKITAVRFVHQGIEFEINGGPVKRKKWSDRIQVGVGGNGIDPRAAQSDDSIYTESSGSNVLLILKSDPSAITTDQIKDLLAPVLDFKAMSQAEAYQKSLPPLIAAAVKNHHALVGMDKDMVIIALGRPPHRMRETKDGQDYEEWIYGTPPQDVEFIRFIGDKVVRIEDMKVTGEKRVRTEDEVGVLGGTLDASAQKQPRPEASAASDDEERGSAPTLLRPGEKEIKATEAARDPAPAPPPDMNPPPASSGSPAPNPPSPMGLPSSGTN